MRILYIDIDSQRPDHLSCYGYHRKTSPTIDRIAAMGLRCKRVYTSDAPCLPSRTAFYSGRLGIQTGVVGHGGSAAEPKNTGTIRGFRDLYDQFGLGRQLQELGFHTAMVSPFGQRHAAHWFYAGFNEIHNTGKGGMESAEEVMPVVNDWLKHNAKKDKWYLHLNLWDPHTPYRVPMSYGDPFKNEPIPDWISDDVLKEHIHHTGPHSASDLGMYRDADPKAYPRQPARITDRATLRQWLDGYDTAVKYVDDQIASIVKQLEEAGVYDDTAIIISADHGENQGELGLYGEHATADEQTCHVPMIIKWPGGVKGKTDDALHYSLDLAPTLMDLLGGKKPEIWDGRSFADTVKSGAPSGREELVVSQCCHVLQRSVRYDNWLYIRTYHDGFHLFPDEMLFDIVKDPHEQHNLAASKPEVVREASYRLSQWHADQMQKMTHYASNPTDPLWLVQFEGGPAHAQHNPDPRKGESYLVKYLPRLEQTGRADGAAALREKYGKFLKG
ncbi:MAG: sulfatase-like hydrolase/transferase [Phycisphaera sp.]|nr:sulfatase-like hydrolase/transferase [Phycisphaera sp.]